MLAVEEVDQRPLQGRALPRVEPVTGPAELGAAGVVDQAQASAQLDVIKRLLAEVGLTAPGADDLVSFLPANGRTVVGEVGQFHEQVVQCPVGLGESGLHGGHLVTQGGSLLLGLGGIRTGRLQLADFLSLPVPLSTGGIDLGGELAPQCVRFQDRVQVNVVGALEQGRPHVLRVRPDQLHIKHRL